MSLCVSCKPLTCDLAEASHARKVAISSGDLPNVSSEFGSSRMAEIACNEGHAVSGTTGTLELFTVRYIGLRAPPGFLAKLMAVSMVDGPCKDKDFPRGFSVTVLWVSICGNDMESYSFPHVVKNPQSKPSGVEKISSPSPAPSSHRADCRVMSEIDISAAIQRFCRRNDFDSSSSPMLIRSSASPTLIFPKGWVVLLLAFVALLVRRAVL